MASYMLTVDKSRVEESDCCDGDNWNFESIFK